MQEWPRSRAARRAASSTTGSASSRTIGPWTSMMATSPRVRSTSFTAALLEAEGSCDYSWAGVKGTGPRVLEAPTGPGSTAKGLLTVEPVHEDLNRIGDDRGPAAARRRVGRGRSVDSRRQIDAVRRSVQRHRARTLRRLQRLNDGQLRR